MKIKTPQHLFAGHHPTSLTWFQVRKRLFRATVGRVYTPLIKMYLSKDRKYTWEGIKILVPAGVFHPGLFFTTTNMLAFLKNENLKGKSFLELGAGTGLIAIFAAKQGAIASASDISGTAINCINFNAKNNLVHVSAILSDVLISVPKQAFDYIIVCPPFFKGNPENEAAYGWFAGANYEFFSKLFSQLTNCISAESKVYMKLSEDLDLESIINMAKANNFEFVERKRKMIMFENQLIFQIIQRP